MELGQLFPQSLGGGIGIQPQPAIHSRRDRGQDPGRGRVRVLVGVKLDQTFDSGLFAGDIGVQFVNQWTDELGIWHQA
jgi:hypothetical protein